MPTLTDWTWIVTMAVQAMLGAVSGNVRMIALSYAEGRWRFDFHLENDDPIDREAAEDIASDLQLYLNDIRDRISSAAYARVDLEVAVGRDRLPVEQSQQRRILFLRREATS